MLSHDDYTIGWISALPLELAAAKVVLDKVHPKLSPPGRDRNSYTFGEIRGHNVVLTCLPYGVYGTNAAGAVAEQMLSTFSSIRFGLMYDYGKTILSGKVERTGVLNKPPPILLKALSDLVSDHWVGRARFHVLVPVLPQLITEGIY
ncbi:hypothetical protein AFLA70_17g005700 [Aspergillus flavus AF70]|nr:hypothetical protein AFLA70_17g005700 [Aspergillus flavus AF70]